MTERADPVGLLPRSGVGRAALLAVLWTVVGVIFALPNIGGPGGTVPPLVFSLTQWWAWGLVAPLVVAADRRLPFSDRELARRLAAHLALSLAFTVLYVYLTAALRASAQLIPWQAVFTTALITNALGGMYLWGWLVYWVILGAWLALNYYERFVTSELRRERLERRFSEARLNNLRLQLDPHFLFNALNTVSSQVERDPRLARRMIEHLGDLLRLSLDSKDRQEVTLTEELVVPRSLPRHSADPVRRSPAHRDRRRAGGPARLGAEPDPAAAGRERGAPWPGEPRRRRHRHGHGSTGRRPPGDPRPGRRRRPAQGLAAGDRGRRRPVGDARADRRAAPERLEPVHRDVAPQRRHQRRHLAAVAHRRRGADMTASLLRVLVVDDEEPARQRLVDLLRRDAGVGAIVEASDGLAAVDAIERERPDLVFLDVQMPELDGLGVVDAVGAARMPLTVFVTAYDQHAVRAFEANALDYLLKPFSDERHEATMARARARLGERDLRGFGQRLIDLAATGQRAALLGSPGGEGRRHHAVRARRRDRLDRRRRRLRDAAPRGARRSSTAPPSPSWPSASIRGASSASTARRSSTSKASCSSSRCRTASSRSC